MRQSLILRLVIMKCTYMATILFGVTETPCNGRFGGGVCFYIRSCINFSVRHDLCLEQLENLCILVNKPRAKPFLISTWYRPPNSPVVKFNFFETLLGKLDSENIEHYPYG